MADRLVGARWRKSTDSGDNNGACVEVATNLPGLVAVRDSKDPAGPALSFSPTAWSTFVRATKTPHRAVRAGRKGARPAR